MEFSYFYPLFESEKYESMWIILLFFIAGTLIGRISYKKLRLVAIISRLTFFVVLMLLLLLGIQAGSNKEFVSGFASIGVSAIVLGIFSALGSILAIYFIYPHKSK